MPGKDRNTEQKYNKEEMRATIYLISYKTMLFAYTNTDMKKSAMFI